MKSSYSHFKHIVQWGLIGINLKKSVFSITTFPEIKAKWYKMDQNQGFQNKTAFQIDPESLPDHFPTLFDQFQSVFNDFLKGWV